MIGFRRLSSSLTDHRGDSSRLCLLPFPGASPYVPARPTACTTISTLSPTRSSSTLGFFIPHF